MPLYCPPVTTPLPAGRPWAPPTKSHAVYSVPPLHPWCSAQKQTSWADNGTFTVPFVAMHSRSDAADAAPNAPVVIDGGGGGGEEGECMKGCQLKLKNKERKEPKRHYAQQQPQSLWSRMSPIMLAQCGQFVSLSNDAGMSPTSGKSSAVASVAFFSSSSFE